VLKEKDLPPDTPIKLQGNDTYEDFTIPTSRALVLGLTQSTLIIYYVDGMFKKLKQLHEEIEITDSCDYSDEEAGPCAMRQEYEYYYWRGVIIQLGFFIGKDSWGSVTRSIEFWGLILKLMNGSKNLVWKPETELPDPVCYWWLAFELLVRSFFSLAINPAALGFIVLALPFQVAVGSPLSPEVTPLNFVLGVVAAFFIIEIDNLAVPKVFYVTKEQSVCHEEHQPETPIDHTDSRHTTGRMASVETRQGGMLMLNVEDRTTGGESNNSTVGNKEKDTDEQSVCHEEHPPETPIDHTDSTHPTGRMASVETRQGGMLMLNVEDRTTEGESNNSTVGNKEKKTACKQVQAATKPKTASKEQDQPDHIRSEAHSSSVTKEQSVCHEEHQPETPIDHTDSTQHVVAGSLCYGFY
jgi:hypothetical protein